MFLSGMVLSGRLRAGTVQAVYDGQGTCLFELGTERRAERYDMHAGSLLQVCWDF